jgi:hypothetical protein
MPCLAPKSQQLLSFLSPLLDRLDGLIDQHLVRTLLDSVTAILVVRYRAKTLVRSELGALPAKLRWLLDIAVLE